MSYKVVLIGGGSYKWTPGLSTDLFLTQSLSDSELVLVDINPDAAKLLQAYCRMMAQKVGTGWKISIADLAPALDGADIVSASISTGGLDAMHLDYTIPEKYGIYHTVGDTTGPAGISRTLRNIPIFVDFARKMEKYCPHAWMAHVTNPLSQITRAISKATSIRAVGLCHNYVDTLFWLADYLGVAQDDIEAVSVGVNHYTWLKDITVKGRPVDTSTFNTADYLRYEANQKEPLKTGTTDDEINEMTGGTDLEFYLTFELYNLFGYLPIGAAPHIAESLPWYNNSPETLKRHHIRRKGVLPGRHDGNQKKRQQLVDIVEGKGDLPAPKQSRETFASVVEALLTGCPGREVISYPNEGQITNLSRDAVVETWVTISANRVSPVNAGAVPDPLAGYMQMIVDEQELSIEAALTGNRQKVVQAMTVSPMVQNKDIVADLADELLAANKDLLPQFNK